VVAIIVLVVIVVVIAPPPPIVYNGSIITLALLTLTLTPGMIVMTTMTTGGSPRAVSPTSFRKRSISWGMTVTRTTSRS